MQGNEKYVKVNGSYITLEQFSENFICSKCGGKELAKRYIKSNNSWQLRCMDCNEYYGCIKYNGKFGGGNNAPAGVSK